MVLMGVAIMAGRRASVAAPAAAPAPTPVV